MKATSRVQVDMRGLASYRRLVERAEDAALREVGGRIASTAHGITGGYDISEITRSARPSGVVRTRRGRAIDVVATHPLAMIFEKGSYRKGRGKRQPGNPGVKPVRFLRNSLRLHRPDLIPALRRRMP